MGGREPAGQIAARQRGQHESGKKRTRGGQPAGFIRTHGEVKIPTPFFPLCRLAVLTGLMSAAALTACGPSAPPPVERESRPLAEPPSRELRPDVRPPNGGLNAPGGSQRQRQAEFLNRIRQADPQFKTIDRAVLNDRNELGLILDRSVAMDTIPALMRTMLTQLAKEFPGQDLDVTAYAPSNPPTKIGTARLDARTREMSYTAEHP